MMSRINSDLGLPPADLPPWRDPEGEGMAELNCVACGILFAIPAPYYWHRKRDGKPFCCPNGCFQHYPIPMPKKESIWRRLWRAAP